MCQVRLKNECNGKDEYLLADGRKCCGVCLICVGGDGATPIDNLQPVIPEMHFVDERSALSLAPAGKRWD